MQETGLIKRIRRFGARTPQHKQVVVGIGDDCTVVRPSPNEDLVFTTDFTIEDRHFTTTTHTAADVGWKALARSLSDLAAMGAAPIFCTVSLAIPGRLDTEWIENFYEGLTQLARRYNVTLAGGDLAKSEKIVADVMCCGSVPRGKALLRSGARAGDFIYVTGALGLSALGLELQTGEAWQRHKRPLPQLLAGIELREIATAAMDLSDGLSLDLSRLCDESGVGAELDVALPIGEGATLAQGLHGGEDYELLFSAKPETEVPSIVAGTSVTKIGAITKDEGVIRYAGSILEPLGFDHFR